ncbi:integrase family protein [Rhizobium phaseoli]|nr:integrase family protein [Rhizobium phaseoli]
MDIPEARCDGLWNVKSWHHLLWKELMRSGHWTRAFFATGRPEPISLKQTIFPRVRIVKNAWRWMHAEGLIPEYFERIDQLLLSNKVAALKKHFDQISLKIFGLDKIKSTYRKRRNPRRQRILTRDEIRALVGATGFGPTKLIILLILFVGFRREEVAQNNLCPGHVYQRSARHLELDEPSFPREPYRLSHGDDDDMIGVMPSIDVAFLPDDEARERCTYRIIGKGLKIRRVHIPFKLMRLIWHYYLRERKATVRRNAVNRSDEPACFFLNRFGEALSENAITRQVNRARIRAQKLLGATIAVDVHTLRHTHACIYLEAVILGSAAKDGLNPDNLSLPQIENYGKGAILILKENLGHAELATTERYLSQLASGKLALQYQKLFDEFIDPLLTDLERQGSL